MINYSLSHFQEMEKTQTCVLSEDIKKKLQELSKLVDATNLTLSENSINPPHSHNKHESNRQKIKPTYFSTNVNHGSKMHKNTTASMQLNQNKNQLCESAQIRLLLNKITDKNHEEYTLKIMHILDYCKITEEIAKDIFQIVSGNLFYVKIYAQVFSKLAKKYTELQNIMESKKNQYLDDFMHIEIVDESDYNLFCKMNEETDKRKSLSAFFIALTKTNTMQKSDILHFIIELLKMISVFMFDEKHKHQMDELSEHVFLLFDKDILHYISTLSDVPIILCLEKKYSLIEFIHFLSKCSIKTFKGLTSKSIFKFDDIYHKIHS